MLIIAQWTNWLFVIVTRSIRLIDKGPHWFAVSRLTDNRLSGLMRELAELIDDESEPAKLRDLRVSLEALAAGASEKAYRLSKGRVS